MIWLKGPWDDKGVQKKYGIKKSRFDKYVDKENIYLKNSNGTFEKEILTGLNDSYAGKKYEECMYINKNEIYKDVAECEDYPDTEEGVI